MKEKLISIIAPAYNHEQYIIKSLESIVNQTYPNKELIIIDDCSNDNTIELIEEFISDNDIKAKFDEEIKLIKREVNEGAHSSINKGLNMAKGEYLTIINTDDMYENNRLELMINEMEKTKSEISFSKVEIIDFNNNIIRNNQSKYYNFIQNNMQIYKSATLALIIDNIAISSGNMIFTKDLYNKIGEFKDYKSVHDWDFILRACIHTEPLYVLNTNYLYRIHNNNSFKELRKNPELCHEEWIRVITNFFKKIQNNQTYNSKIPQIDILENFVVRLQNKKIYMVWKDAKYNMNFQCY